MIRRVALHLSVLVVGAAVLRVAIVPAEVCPPATAAEVRTSIDEATGWITRNMTGGGRYTYGYDRGEDRPNLSYNSARHAGVTMSLYQVALEHDPGVVEAADRGLAYMLERIVEHDDWAAWSEYRHEIELGPNGLFLAALALRREATGDEQYDDLMRAVGRYVLAEQLPDGSFYAYWDRVNQRPIPLYAAFATGQSAWALMLLEHQLPGEGWADTVLPTLTWIATDRDRAEGRIARLPDHWAAYALEEVPAAAWTDEHLALSRRLTGYFGMRLRFEAQRRGDGINLALRWFPGPPAGVGTAGEGIGALWRLSAEVDGLGDLRANMEDRLACTAGMMASRQVTAAQAGAYGSPDLARGAWFYRGYTQMDDQQHVISALLSALPVIEAREVSE